jgi:hypothetical protein
MGDSFSNAGHLAQGNFVACRFTGFGGAVTVQNRRGMSRGRRGTAIAKIGRLLQPPPFFPLWPNEGQCLTAGWALLHR